MDAVERPTWLAVDEYLTGEPRGDVRHEYVGGVVYAMAGGSAEHNTICLSLAAALRRHLRGGHCHTFMADVKVRVSVANDDIFYYPDVMVSCDPRDTDRFFKRFPKALIEVLSETTERTDRREKLLSYTQIETLEEYVLVAQDKMEVTLYRRASQWRPELFNAADERLHMPSIDFSLALSDIYEGVTI
jgi:Uma2 family endonuclease